MALIKLIKLTPLIPVVKLFSLVQSLNIIQKLYFSYFMIKTYLMLKTSRPFYEFISGPTAVRKSRLLSAINQALNHPFSTTLVQVL